jgi:hypothetical protein
MSMNHNVYLPDEISERAKAAELNLSGLLRAAVIDALDRRDALEGARDGMVGQNIDIDHQDGRALQLRFTGKHVAGGTIDVYLTDNGTVVLVFADDYETFKDVALFCKWAADKHRHNFGPHGESTIRDAMTALGGRTVIDL